MSGNFELAVALSEINNYDAAERERICTQAVEALTRLQQPAPASEPVQQLLDLTRQFLELAQKAEAERRAQPADSYIERIYLGKREAFEHAAYLAITVKPAPAPPYPCPTLESCVEWLQGRGELKLEEPKPCPGCLPALNAPPTPDKPCIVCGATAPDYTALSPQFAALMRDCDKAEAAAALAKERQP